MDFGKPFLANVLKGCWGGDGEAHKENVGLGVRQGSQSIVVFLPGGIKESECVRLITDPGQPTSVHVLRPNVSRSLELRHKRGEKDQDMRQDRQASRDRAVTWFAEASEWFGQAGAIDEDLHHRHRIVIEDCRDIFRGEFVGGVRDEQARLANSTVTNDNTSRCLVSACASISCKYR